MRPVTVQVVASAVQVNEPGEDVTVYRLIAAPPSDDGAVHDTSTELSPNTVVTVRGAVGLVAGRAAADCAETSPEPLALLATTVKT